MLADADSLAPRRPRHQLEQRQLVTRTATEQADAPAVIVSHQQALAARAPALVGVWPRALAATAAAVRLGRLMLRPPRQPAGAAGAETLAAPRRQKWR